MARGFTCGAHVHRYLVPVESHHVWPLGYHGPDVPENREKLCANAHGDAHYLLERMLKLGGPVPWEERRTYGVGVRAVAERGFVAVMSYAAGIAPK